MTYKEAMDELKDLSLKLESEELELDELELLLKRAEELNAICRQALRNVSNRLDDFQNQILAEEP